MKKSLKFSNKTSWQKCGCRIIKLIFAFCLVLSFAAVSHAQQGKPVIYQMMTRLFGNQNATNKFYGSIEENGVGKFNDINDSALESLKTLGVTYIWYTGVLAHATMTDYSKYGIRTDDPDVVKGRAGSPYAVKDYYDVDPDLAVNVPDRMREYQALIDRTHRHGLKVIMDFIPNHVARSYYAAAKPASVVGFGEKDDTSVAFSPKNDFYYIPKTSFVVPQGVDAGGANFHSPLKDGKFDEHPAKATGNNVFKPDPSIDDWYETIKLNYGVDVQNGGKEYFNPIPPVWTKMRDILQYWAKKGVDGFRCDAAEMAPAAFWHWVIPQIKQLNPDIIFIAEAYDPQKYQQYIDYGHFDYLYNKVGLYDVLKSLIKDENDANTQKIDSVMQAQRAFSSHMLNFLENHDEERIASKAYADNAWRAKPAMAIAATVSDAPVMLYFGQELGEKADSAEGFGSDDGRTTIFDYWSVPTVRRWADSGKFDEKNLSDSEKNLRGFYQKLFHIVQQISVINDGEYREVKDGDITDTDVYSIPDFDTMTINGIHGNHFAYLRYDKNDTILVVANFDRDKDFSTTINIPTKNFKHTQATDLLTQRNYDVAYWNVHRNTEHPSLTIFNKSNIKKLHLSNRDDLSYSIRVNVSKSDVVILKLN